MPICLQRFEVCSVGPSGPKLDQNTFLQKLETTKTGSTSSSSSGSDSSSSSGAAHQRLPTRARKPRVARVNRSVNDISGLANMLSEMNAADGADADGADVGAAEIALAAEVEPGKEELPASAPAAAEEPAQEELPASAPAAAQEPRDRPDVRAFIETLLEDGFETGRKSTILIDAARDEIEEQEEKDIEDIAEESGINMMREHESRLIDHAIGAAASASSKSQTEKDVISKVQLAKSPVFEQNIAKSIGEFVTSGLDPEDAATEAMLNQDSLLGNEATLPPSSGSVSGGATNEQATGEVEDHVDLGLQAGFARWSEQCALSIQALQARNAALSTPVGHQKELSLVLQDENVIFVHWKDADKRSGRPASLDKDFGVKCIVPVGDMKEPRDYSSAAIVWPAVGAAMLRQKGYKNMLRPRVPDQVLRVCRMWQHALLAKDSSQESNPLAIYSRFIPSEQPCVSCGESSALPPTADQRHVAVDPGDAVAVCPFCLVWMHQTCALKLVNYAEETGFLFPEDMGISSPAEPDVFAHTSRCLGLLEGSALLVNQ